jgi:TonB family protein
MVFAAVSAFGAPRGRAPLAVKIVAVLSLLLMGAGTMLTPALLYAQMNSLTRVAITGEPGTSSETAQMEVPSASQPPPAPPSLAPEEMPSPQLEDIPEATLPPSTRPSARPRPSPSATPTPPPEEEAAEDSPVEAPVRRGAVRVGGQVPEPKKLKSVSPRYPEIAKQARVQGVVILECTIDTRGRVSDIKVLRSIPLLDAAAVEAVKQWTYEPTYLNGEAVPIIMTVTVNFRLS